MQRLLLSCIYIWIWSAIMMASIYIFKKSHILDKPINFDEVEDAAGLTQTSLQGNDLAVYYNDFLGQWVENQFDIKNHGQWMSHAIAWLIQCRPDW